MPTSRVKTANFGPSFYSRKQATSLIRRIPKCVRQWIRGGCVDDAWQWILSIVGDDKFDITRILREASKLGLFEASLECSKGEEYGGNPTSAYRFASLALDQATTSEDLDRAREVIDRLRWEIFKDEEAIERLSTNNHLEPSAAIAVAQYLAERGNLLEAEQRLSALILDGADEAPIILGNVLANAGRYDEAIAAYKHGFIQYGDYRAANNASLVLSDIGRSDEAEEWARQAASGGAQRAVRRLRSASRRNKASRKRPTRLAT